MGAYEFLNTEADSDSDGLLDGDELDTYGTSPINSNTDGDAHTDYEEMIADTDGTDPDDYFRINNMTIGSPVTVYFVASSNRLYSMEACTNLPSGIWTTIPGAGPRLGAGGSDFLQDTNMLPKTTTYRITVELPDA